MLDVAVVLTYSTILHRHRHRHHDCDYDAIYLPLGSILRATSKFREWLHVETVDGENGYVECEACLPLAQSSLPDSIPIWTGDSNSGRGGVGLAAGSDDGRAGHVATDAAERQVDALYLRAQAAAIEGREKRRLPLAAHAQIEADAGAGNEGVGPLLVRNDYVSDGDHTLSVQRGQLVYLVHAKIKGWLWIRNERHKQGFVPAAVITHLALGPDR